METLSFEKAFERMCKDTEENNIYRFLYPSENTKDVLHFTICVNFAKEENFVSYNQALEKFKSLFEEHFTDKVYNIGGAHIGDAADKIGYKTLRGKGNVVVDDSYLVYASPLVDKLIFDCPFFVLKKDDKYAVVVYGHEDAITSVSDYGLKIN